MNIGIDIDDTINKLYDKLIVKGTEFNKEEKIDFEIQKDQWHWDKSFGWDEETAHRFLIKNIEELYLSAGIKENAAEIINKLRRRRK